MFDTNTQYALNKRTADAIVYVDAFGKRIEVTADGLDAEEFAIWKELLDEDLHKALNVSQTTAYRLLHSDDFPVVMIGKRRMVTKHDLMKWMNKQVKVTLN